MSSEVYLGEVDCRRIEALTYAVEQLTAALVESQNTSTNKPSTKSCATCEHESHDHCSYCMSCVKHSRDNWEPRKTSCVG